MNAIVAPTSLDDVVSRALVELPGAERVQVDGDMPGVVADEVLLERVVANLLANAVRYGEHVQVSASRAPGRVMLHVTDDGPGVEVGDRARMFEPFQRLGHAPQGAGVGLGLAVARGLTEAQGGSLCVSDTPRGRAHHDPLPARGPTVRILVVDDDPGLLRTLGIGLRPLGHEVMPAADGRTALQAAHEDDPDLVVLDLGLPDLDGVEVLRRLRAWTQVPIIVLSARAESRDKVEALDLGADDYVTKPFDMEELAARIRSAGRRGGVDPPAIDAGELHIDTTARRVTRSGVPVRLTPTEWALLEVLLRARGRLVGRQELLREVWGPAYHRETHYLRVYVASLRKKLETDPSHPRHLITEPGIGYRFEA